MRINILFPGNTRRPTGGYKVIYEYCNKLCKRHDITINYLYGSIFSGLHLPESVRKLMDKLYGEMIGPGKWFKLDKRIKKRVISSPSDMRGGDIVVATAVKTADMVNDLSDKYGKKVYFIQDFENWSILDEEVIRTYTLGMTNVVVSGWLKKLVDSYDDKESYLVSNCIDTDVFQNLNLKREAHSIVFHYRSASNKGCEYTLETIEILKKIYNDLQVNVITSEKQIPAFPEYFTVYKQIGSNEVAKINNKSEVFMCSTIEEGFGLPGLEAMACGCAVVITDYKGSREYAIDGYNSLVSPTRDAKAMADNIVKLFENKELKAEICRNGIETGKCCSLDKSSLQFERILLKVNDRTAIE